MTALQTAHNALEIGRRIQAVRMAFEESPAQFARRVGISAQSLSNYETGYRRPGLDQAILICVATGVTLDWIYFGDNSGLPMRFASLAAGLAEPA